MRLLDLSCMGEPRCDSCPGVVHDWSTGSSVDQNNCAVSSNVLSFNLVEHSLCTTNQCLFTVLNNLYIFMLYIISLVFYCRSHSVFQNTWKIPTQLLLHFRIASINTIYYFTLSADLTTCLSLLNQPLIFSLAIFFPNMLNTELCLVLEMFQFSNNTQS